MSINIAVSVEGQTEESFINNVLAPYLSKYNIFIEPIIVVTKRTANKSYKGGTIRFEKFVKDISNLCNPKYHFVTTFYDYYALQKDFMPSMLSKNVYENVKLIENKMSIHINNEKFIPYIQLHEFETFLFIEPYITANNLFNCNENHVIKKLSTALHEFQNNPELVNSSSETAPSKRILSIYPNYQKIFDGINICKNIGVKKIRECCPHFNNWIESIIKNSNLISQTTLY